MRRQEDLPIKKVTLNLYEGDFEFFQQHFPRSGAGKAIRTIVRSTRKKIEGMTEQRLVIPPELSASELAEATEE